MIDPITTLAFSMHASKGVYAVLLGSGISRAARIPTGWDITLELVRKVAALQGADCEPDPAAWFTSTTGKPPDYSVLLDALAKTPPERQQLLRSYWEPTDKEREEGAKLPTKAHRALADLVKRGYVRVIITTNFDRLMEIALQDVGIQPAVISSVDQLAGALPLIHTPCTIIKLHGDYLDTRIRNTPEELSAYPKELDNLLDRVLDEFGLIVAGWSGEWDEALRSAITRAPNRRFSMYWAARGEPGERAKQLIAHRQAQVIATAGADDFFGSVSEKVRALEEFARPHSLSTEAAVATLKKYLSESKYRISLDDLVREEVSRAREAIRAANLPLAGDFTGDLMLARLRTYEGAVATLMKMAFTAGRWSDRTQVDCWSRALIALGEHPVAGGLDVYLEYRKYPAALVMFCFGLGAVQGENWEPLGMLLETRLARENERAEARAVELLTPWTIYARAGDVMKILPGRDRQHTPLQMHLHELLYPMLRENFVSEKSFQGTFDRLEMLLALCFAKGWEGDRHYWAPAGMYGWRTEFRDRIFQDFDAQVAKNGPMVPLMGTDAAAAARNIEQLKHFIARLRWW